MPQQLGIFAASPLKKPPDNAGRQRVFCPEVLLGEGILFSGQCQRLA